MVLRRAFGRVLGLAMFFSTAAHAVSLAELLHDNSRPREIVFKTAGGAPLRLYVFSPADLKAGDRRTAVVWIHGGGWTAGGADAFFPHARYYAIRGAIGISIEYRLMKPHGPALADCLADARSAIRYVRSHAREMGVNPERIVAMGDSAGGHLAGALATIAGFDDPEDDLSVSAMPNAAVLYNPIVDLTEGTWIKYLIGGAAMERNAPLSAMRPDAHALQLARALSPVFHVRGGLPPMMVLHGLDDKTVRPDQARRFAATMKQAGNRCDLSLYENTRHAFVVTNYTAPDATVVRAIREGDEFLGSLGFLEGAPSLEAAK